MFRVAVFLVALGLASSSRNDTFAIADLDRDVRSFLDREAAAHLAAVTSLDPPVERVHGALTTGEYTWGTFMRALAAYAQLSSAATLGGRDLARTIADIRDRHGVGPEEILAAASLRDRLSEGAPAS